MRVEVAKIIVSGPLNINSAQPKTKYRMATIEHKFRITQRKIHNGNTKQNKKTDD